MPRARARDGDGDGDATRSREDAAPPPRSGSPERPSGARAMGFRWRSGGRSPSANLRSRIARHGAKSILARVQQRPLSPDEAVRLFAAAAADARGSPVVVTEG